MGARALTRVSLIAATAACAPAPQPGAALHDHERVIGRAVHGGMVTLLTDAPALVRIEPKTSARARIAIARGRGDRKLWGLGEANGSLYTISGFTELLRVNLDGTTKQVASFERPMGNLFDTAEGMAGQIAIDSPSTNLAWAVDHSASLTPIQGAVRLALGLSRAEDAVLQLLSCSTPPRVVCWLPGSNQILSLAGRTLEATLQLDSVGWISPARLLERPESRVIHDALVSDRNTIFVLFRPSPAADRTSLAEFGSDGRMIRRIDPETPLRLLIGMTDSRLLAIAKSGGLIEVRP